ncbi:MAG: TIGR04282 family arsenosugar biosynthesis glycosyltransferase [Gammaproteobacteria bacterium]|nr:TIGR04282 family arsenosugar biosynthesis glycosyltransferase [Gammaproteobacteria bacterium]
MIYPESAIMVFAKAPVAGEVKTRLSSMLGARGAARLHASMVRHVLSRLDGCALSPVQLWCAPDCRHPFFSSCRRKFSVRLRSQAPGDLGQRMHRAFQFTLKSSPYALLIGTDAPELTGNMIKHSLLALKNGKDAVFVPALDGGYVLVGLRKPVRGLFSGIQWGSEDVMKETRERLRKHQLDWLELPPCGDIDTKKDLKRMKRDASVTVG